VHVLNQLKGQIEYIFSDKTGTLTSNMMEFRKCSINGVLYGDSFVTEASKGAAGREGVTVDEQSIDAAQQEAHRQMMENMSQLFDTKYVSPKLSFVDPLLPQHVKEGQEQGLKIREFFTLLAVCHTVLVETPDKSNPNQLEYKAQSPDEAALVTAARDVGFAFLRRTDNRIDIDLLGEIRSYTVLNVLEFNSNRKRMSVIVRRPEGQVVLLVKGADSIILERLRKPTADDEVDTTFIEETTSAHLNAFATEGLRTLCLAYKVIPNHDYEAWAERFCAAQATIKDREKNVDAVAELIETDLTLMGATAIEDKLQDGVPETIGLLAKAGIKIWVLTVNIPKTYKDDIEP
jgi:phospholipid-translocating ATPase